MHSRIDTAAQLHSLTLQGNQIRIEDLQTSQRMEALLTVLVNYVLKSEEPFISVAEAAKIVGSQANSKPGQLKFFRDRGIEPRLFGRTMGFSIAEWPGILAKIRQQDKAKV